MVTCEVVVKWEDANGFNSWQERGGDQDVIQSCLALNERGMIKGGEFTRKGINQVDLG